MHIMMFNHSPGRHGTFFRCFYLAKYLAKRKHQVSLITLNPQKNELLTKRNIKDGVEIFDTFSLRTHHDYIGMSISAVLNPLRWLSSQPDIVHAFAVTSGCTATPVLLHRILNKIRVAKEKMISDVDDWWDRRLSFFWFLFNFFEKEAFKGSDGITVPSELLKQRAMDLGAPAERIHYLPNGSNVDFIKPLQRSKALDKLGLQELGEQHILLYIGRTGGFSLFLQTLEELFSKRNDVKALFVGDFHPEDELAVRKLTFSKNVIMLGWQPYTKIPLYCGAADVLIFPMGKGPIEAGRSSITLGDYLAAGRPIVSNAKGETKKVLSQDECGVIASDDPRDFAQKIDMLIENPKLCRVLGSRARKVAEEKFAWSVIAKKLEYIYSTI